MDAESETRNAQEVARRVLALLGVIGLAHQREQALSWIKSNGIAQYFSPDEMAFHDASKPDDHNLIQFSWRAEAVVPMIWALQGLDEMPDLTRQFDIFENALIREAFRNPSAFVQSAVLRPEEQLNEMEGYLYHQHWRVRDRDLGFNMDKPDANDPPIDMLDSGIVMERRYGMSWIVGAGDSWDDVPTDT